MVLPFSRASEWAPHRPRPRSDLFWYQRGRCSVVVISDWGQVYFDKSQAYLLSSESSTLSLSSLDYMVQLISEKEYEKHIPRLFVVFFPILWGPWHIRLVVFVVLYVVAEFLFFLFLFFFFPGLQRFSWWKINKKYRKKPYFVPFSSIFFPYDILSYDGFNSTHFLGPSVSSSSSNSSISSSLLESVSSPLQLQLCPVTNS